MKWKGRSEDRETRQEAAETVKARGDEGLAANSNSEQIVVK